MSAKTVERQPPKAWRTRASCEGKPGLLHYAFLKRDFLKDAREDWSMRRLIRCANTQSRGAGFGFLADQSNKGADPKPNLLGNMPLPVPNTMTFAPIGVRL